MDKKNSILIIEDDKETCEALASTFKKKDYRVEVATTGREAIKKAKESFFNGTILDIRLPDMDGMEILTSLKKMHPDMAIIIITAYASVESATKAMKNGVAAYITKPFKMDELLAEVKGALERQRLVIKNIKLAQSLKEELAERKRKEQALKETEEKLRAILNSLPDHANMLDRDLNIIWANDAAKRAFGDDIVGKKCYTALYKRRKPCQPYPCLALKTFGDGQVHEHDTQVIDKDGKIIYLHCTTNAALRDEKEKPLTVIEILRDMTERKKSEESLEESERKYRKLYESSKDGIAFSDIQGNLLDGNQAFLNMLGYTKEEIRRLTYQKITPDKWHKMEENIIKNQVMTRGFSNEYEKEYIKKDGTVFPIAIRVWVVKDEKGKNIGLWAIIRDISKRKKAEVALQKSEEDLKVIIENINDVIFQLSPSGFIKYVSPKVEKLYGYKPQELIGKHLKKTTPAGEVPKALGAIKSVLKGEEIKNFELNQLDSKGKIVNMEINITPVKEGKKIIAIQGVMRDITERKRAEEKIREAYNTLRKTQIQLVQSEKVASIGQMATGVAHEVNNPLTAISGEAEILSKDKDKDVKEASKVIVEQTKRIKGIIERLLEFSYKKELKLKPLDINNTIEKSIFLLKYRVKLKNIEIARKLDTNLPRVLGDDNHLQEVFLNIMLNAVQAMEKGGRLTIRTSREKITEYGRRETDIFKEGQEIVAVEFKDTGKGMDKVTLLKVFDPFFTTKEKNTGLGLSICHGIIKSHKGTIEAYSKLKEGSTFIVKLPTEGGRE